MRADNAFEFELLARINSCERCAINNVTAVQGERFGVLVLHRGVPVALWSYRGGEFKFRNLSSYDELRTAPDAEQAAEATAAMGEWNRWR